MQLSLRLREILNELRVNHHGIIKEICQHTQLERHQVASIMHNRVQYLNLDALTAICEYLVERHDFPSNRLPGALFELSSSNFMAMIARRRTIDVCFGARWSPPHDERFVVASDSVLHGFLLREITSPTFGPERRADQSLKQQLVSVYDKANTPESKKKLDEAIKEATDLYRSFDRRGGDRALVLLGSMKSNPVIELSMGHILKLMPFTKMRQIEHPSDCQSPVYFQLRPDDKVPGSCAAGDGLKIKGRKAKPGIYFEGEDGEWVACPVNANEDAAMVLYDYEPAQGRLELIMGGFSGKSTRALGESLGKLSSQFWPPNYDEESRRCGLFVVAFDLKKHSSKVHRVSESVMKRRLELSA